MNRIYQGRVSNVEIKNILSASTGERNNGEVSKQNPWKRASRRYAPILTEPRPGTRDRGVPNGQHDIDGPFRCASDFLVTDKIRRTACANTDFMYISLMEATLSELQRQVGRIMRWVRGGESVRLTDRGRPVARIVPEVESRQVSLAEFCQAEMRDEAILDAIDQGRE